MTPLEKWAARRPRGLEFATARSWTDDPGDITLRIHGRTIEAVAVADLDAIIADVRAIREWLASRPGPDEAPRDR